MQLLDDNREVYVPEKDEVVRADSRFRIFATQNPVGAYAGRKRLSRAFLNRFVVLNVQPPPADELAAIVCARCGVHATAAALMIDVMTELKRLRSGARLFSAADAFMTLRDLFRWASRVARYPDGADWRQVLVEQGYLLLGARCRKAGDARTIAKVLKGVARRELDEDALYALDSPYFPARVRAAYERATAAVGDAQRPSLVLTRAMRRMIVQCAQAFEACEPVLLVGETGCGKTSVVYLLAEVSSQLILDEARLVADGMLECDA